MSNIGLQGLTGDYLEVLSEYRRVHTESYIVAMLRLQHHVGILDQLGPNAFGPDTFSSGSSFDGSETIGLNDHIYFDDDE